MSVVSLNLLLLRGYKSHSSIPVCSTWPMETSTLLTMRDTWPATALLMPLSCQLLMICLDSTSNLPSPSPPPQPPHLSQNPHLLFRSILNTMIHVSQSQVYSVLTAIPSIVESIIVITLPQAHLMLTLEFNAVKTLRLRIGRQLDSQSLTMSLFPQRAPTSLDSRWLLFLQETSFL